MPYQNNSYSIPYLYKYYYFLLLLDTKNAYAEKICKLSIVGIID